MTGLGKLKSRPQSIANCRLQWSHHENINIDFFAAGVPTCGPKLDAIYYNPYSVSTQVTLLGKPHLGVGGQALGFRVLEYVVTKGGILTLLVAC